MKLLDSTKLGRSQVEHPWRFLIAAFVITAIAGVLAAGLEFDSSYEALLPEGAPEVENLNQIRKKIGGTSQIIVAIYGKDPAARIAFGRRLAEKLRNIKEITSISFEFEMDFFKDRGLWLMDVNILHELILAVEKAADITKWQNSLMNLQLDEAAEKEELEAAWKRVDDIVTKSRSDLPFDNVLTSKDDKYSFMLVKPSIKHSDIQAGHDLLEAIHADAESLNPKTSGVVVRTAGEFATIQEQHKTMRTDFKNGSIIALVFGMLIVVTFTRKLAAPFVIGTSLIAGVVWAFAIVRLLIGHVNIITGFLVAVLIGLGIDFGIHLFVRYQQELKTEGKNPSSAIIKAVSGTLAPALISALTTAGVFFSFTIADFRGFSEFGLIAGIGVMLTLLSSFLILPPLLAVTQTGKELRPVVSPINSAPRTIGKQIAVTISILVGIGATFGMANIGNIPFRNNFKLLRGDSEATKFLDYVDENLGISINPAVFLSGSAKDAIAIEAIVREQKEAARPGENPSRIGRHFSIGDLLPKNSGKHRSYIQKLRKILENTKLDRVEKKGGERAEKLTQARKMVKTAPWTLNEVPESLRRRLLTQDGKEHLVFVWPNERNDTDYQIIAWEEELELLSEKLDRKQISHSKADERLLIAWIDRLIKKDGLPLLGMAAIVVLLILALDLRSFKQTLLVAFPLAMGMGIFAGVVHIFKLELNMFNLIVVPTLIGIGIDNAVHIFYRYKEEGPGSVLTVLRTTGMAVLLASLTTGVGFGSALVSHHLGLRSMGTLAIIGISSTFLASTIFFPCLLSLLERRKNA